MIDIFSSGVLPACAPDAKTAFPDESKLHMAIVHHSMMLPFGWRLLRSRFVCQHLSVSPVSGCASVSHWQDPPEK